MNKNSTTFGLSTLFAVSVTLISSVAQAETLTQAVEKCRALDDSLQRLVCYDRMVIKQTKHDNSSPVVAAKPKPPTASKPAPKSKPAPAPAVNKPAPQVEFGLEEKVQRERQADSISVKIVNIAERVRGEKTVTFDNGSVWLQVDNSTQNLKVGQQVTIERGLFGAFYLKVKGLNRTMKVKRLK